MSLPFIGEMRERITLTIPTVATDAMGQQIETFGDPFDAWASVMEQNAGEQGNVYEGTELKRKISVIVRNNTSKVFSTRMKIDWRGLSFNVSSIRWLDGPKRFIEMQAESLT